MTSTQSQAVWELCRQGLPLIADDAAQLWDQGRPFEFETPVRLNRTLQALIDQCNRQADRIEAEA